MGLETNIRQKTTAMTINPAVQTRVTKIAPSEIAQTRDETLHAELKAGAMSDPIVVAVAIEIPAIVTVPPRTVMTLPDSKIGRIKCQTAAETMIGRPKIAAVTGVAAIRTTATKRIDVTHAIRAIHTGSRSPRRAMED